MPLYDYECTACGAKREVNHPVSEIGKIKVLCDACHQPMKKLFSIPTLIGFDNAGRSVGRKDNEKEPSKEKASESPAKNDKPSTPTTE